MIVKIHTAKSSIANVSNYNETKARLDGAEELLNEEGNKSKVLAERNIPEGSSIVKEAERLQLMNLKSRHHGPAVSNVTFHMSVNPSETDRKNDEATVVAMIDEIMDGMGYKNQPYKIYRHNDIDREHYHVVSVRVGENGKKINDSFERLKLLSVVRGLSLKYGFTIEETTYEKKQKVEQQNDEDNRVAIPVAVLPKKQAHNKDEDKSNKKTYVPPFKRRGGKPLVEQMEAIHNDALSWSFTTFEQYQALLLRRYMVEVGIEHGDYIEDRLVMTGLDANYKAVTHKMTENQLGIKMLEQIQDRIAESEKMYRRDQKRRIEGLANAAADRCSTYEEFCQLMDRKGVYVVVSWNKSDEPFGVTYLDRATKCAWKGSETKVDLAWLKKKAEERNWTITKDEVQSKIEKRNAMPSRTTKLTKKTEVDPTPKPKSRDAGQKKKALPKIHGVPSSHVSSSNNKKKDALDHLEDLLDGTKISSSKGIKI